MNKKGVESFPFFLFLTVLIAAFILVIGFYQVQTLNEFTSKKGAADSYTVLLNTAEDLKATADQGSFTRVKLKLPINYNIKIANNGIDNDTISLVHGNDTITNTVKFNVLDTTFNNTIGSGTYEIVVFYGALTNETYQPYAMYFE